MKRYFLYLVCTVAFVSATSVTQASILQNAVRVGLNTINDVDAERYIPITGPGQTEFMVGDVFQFVLVMENITNASFLSEPLGTATGGGANYQLAAVGSFAIDAINDPSVIAGAPAGNIDVSFAGTVSVYESNLAALLVDFTTDTFAGATAKVTAGTLLATLSNTVDPDFGTFFNIDDAVAGIPPFPGFSAQAGFTATDVALGFSIVPDGTSITHPSFVTGLPISTSHDVTLDERFFLNQGVNNTEFPFFTDTTIQFTVRQQQIIPEPFSLFVWAGLAALGGILAWKKRK